MLHTFLLVISFILLLTSCSSFGGLRPNDLTSNSYEDYKKCLYIHSADKSKCDYLIPSNLMQPNLTEHRERGGYH